jgi:hypothetical protein
MSTGNPPGPEVDGMTRLAMQRVVIPNPFRSMRFTSDTERSVKERGFLELFQVCADTENDDEEAWAYEHLKALWVKAIAGQDDRVSGLFTVMSWAAQRLYAPSPVGTAGDQ